MINQTYVNAIRNATPIVNITGIQSRPLGSNNTNIDEELKVLNESLLLSYKTAMSDYANAFAPRYNQTFNDSIKSIRDVVALDGLSYEDRHQSYLRKQTNNLNTAIKSDSVLNTFIAQNPQRFNNLDGMPTPIVSDVMPQVNIYQQVSSIADETLLRKDVVNLYGQKNPVSAPINTYHSFVQYQSTEAYNVSSKNLVFYPINTFYSSR